MILVTGGTGTLGRPTVAALQANGAEVRVMSRHARPGVVAGDLLSGVGVRTCLEGAEVVVHLATCRRDDRAAHTLVTAAASAGVRHLIVISIVGIDEIPLPYYQRKLEAEQVIARSYVPHTILRSTQFHNLVARLFSIQRRSPVLLAPDFALQPIAVSEVATRLVELTAEAPAGRATDIGGPAILAGPELAAQWARAEQIRRRIWPLRLPGRTFAAYGSGHNLTPDHRYGTVTFEQFLTQVAEPRP